ncbi:MAG TPA: FHA domain-containing protein [Thermoanaerobaculia bacterium]|nr:FHA domain-containing protein [Thermoanaerobaculia bacterium]
MADKRCKNGHFIDESWDICPYCPPDASEPEMPVVRPSSRSTAEPVRNTPDRRPMASPPPVAPPRRDPPSTPTLERTVAVQKIEGPQAQPKRYVVAWLVGLSGALRGESFPIRMGRNVLGRDRRSDIVVNDDQASAHHADLVFRPEERRFILMDHNSTNGTYVNEMEIEPRRDLMSKDIVRIGSHTFLFIPLCNEHFCWDEEGALK